MLLSSRSTTQRLVEIKLGFVSFDTFSRMRLSHVGCVPICTLVYQRIIALRRLISKRNTEMASRCLIVLMWQDTVAEMAKDLRDNRSGSEASSADELYKFMQKVRMSTTMAENSHVHIIYTIALLYGRLAGGLSSRKPMMLC